MLSCFNLHFPHDIWCRESPFVYLSAIYRSSSMRYLLRSLFHFLIMAFIFLLLSFKSSLYILDWQSFIRLSNIFSQSVAASSHSLDFVFHIAEIFNFNKVQLINYFFHGSCLWCLRIITAFAFRLLASSPQIRETVDFAWILSYSGIAWKLSPESYLRKLWGSPYLFLISQRSLDFIALCPISSKLLLHKFGGVFSCFQWKGKPGFY